ncbi:MAG: enoyl-CoA hydratase-related protein [Gammaproteobacteria bacterium]
MSMRPVLVSELDERGVDTLWLNRIDRRNSLNAELIAELITELRRAEQDPAVRVVVIAGRGDTFCGGADLAWLRSVADGEARMDGIESLAQLLSAVWHFPKPTLARVQGSAYGGGVGLIACCDIAIAGFSARFALPELQLGLIPVVILRHLLRALGSRQARRWCLSGEALVGADALRLGLVHKLVAPGELDAEIERQTALLLRSAPGAARTFKRLLTEFTEVADEDARSIAELATHLQTSAEAREGISAFFAHRRPAWDR